MMILSCESNQNTDHHSYELQTKVHGNLKDTVSRPAQINYICSIDPTSSLVAVKCYDAVLKLITISADSKQLNVTTTRYNNNLTVLLTFLSIYFPREIEWMI